MIDAINVVGDQVLVASTIDAYRRPGVDVPVVFPLTWGAAGTDALDTTLRAAIAPSGASHIRVWGQRPVTENSVLAGQTNAAPRIARGPARD